MAGLGWLAAFWVLSGFLNLESRNLLNLNCGQTVRLPTPESLVIIDPIAPDIGGIVQQPVVISAPRVEIGTRYRKEHDKDTI